MNKYGMKGLPKWDYLTAGMPPEGGPLAWSGKEQPPAIGARVRVTFNQFGPGEVVSYFQEQGYLGVEVKCDKRPAWHVKQNGDTHPNPLCFGIEIEGIK